MTEGHFFFNYHQHLSANTLGRHQYGMALLARYLQTIGWEVSADDLLHRSDPWCNLTGKTVEQFSGWLLQQGYAVGTISMYLSMLKTYCRVVSEAGLLTHGEFALIHKTNGFYNAKGSYIDQARDIQRVGYKRAESIPITHEQARSLKIQPDTPQGLRDTFLMSLLLDHGLRVCETEMLMVQNLNLESGTLTFHRERTERLQQIHLTLDTKRAAFAYVQRNHPTSVLLMGSKQAFNSELYGGMKARSIGQRVSKLGKRIGIEGLAPSDCRIYWLSLSASDDLPLPDLKEKGISVLTTRYAPYYKEQKLLSLWEA